MALRLRITANNECGLKAQTGTTKLNASLPLSPLRSVRRVQKRLQFSGNWLLTLFVRGVSREDLHPLPG